MTVPAITDPQAEPKYGDSWFQRKLESMLYEPRDAVFARLALKNLLIIAPLQIALYVWFSWWLAAAVWVVQIAWMAPPCILMLHNTMHRPFFKEPRWLNKAVPFTMSLLFGIPTGYMEHHVGMHHAENNLRNDLSSTMKYQRDSFLHWLMYVGRFLALIHIELPQYFLKKKRNAMAWRPLKAEAVVIGLMIALSFVNWQATIAAFVVPYFFMRFAMMWGNWGQHAFIDASQPGNSYVNSITCINSTYNQRCFNDGYHIGHHVTQTRHWTDLPRDFLANQERYLKEGCIVFEGIDFFMVSLFLFLKRYDWLAKRFVRMPGDTRTEEQIIAFLKERTRRIADEVPEGVVMNA
ncbi:MAG: fatty acid desaturase [Archangium sp.]|nr:fatty acid desaturase [Archangium sp.]